MRPLCQKSQHRGINGDGRSDRASLQDSSLCVHPHPPPRRPVGTHGLCVRCVKSHSVVVLTGTDARPPRRRVGTHGLCVRCVKGYSVQATKSRSFDNGRSDRASLQYSSLCVHPHPPTLPCRDARSVRPLRQRLHRRGINGDGRSSPTSSCRDARSVRPLCQKLQRRGINGDGRSDRASLQ